MVELYGGHFRREELLSHVGSLAQVGGVQLSELSDGRERGVRVADFRTGSGFRFTVHIDRALDIGAAEFRGYALGYRSVAGAVGPAYYDSQGAGWLNGFPGGLMVTCGLSYAGHACEDQSQALGLHGPISYSPAQNVYADGDWQGDDYEMFVQGRAYEASPLGHKIELARRISARLGESRLFVHDRVTNQGPATVPHMIMYHCNLGFPLVDESAELVARVRQTVPATEGAREGQSRYDRFDPPQSVSPDQVFYHDVEADVDGYVTVNLLNRALRDGKGLGLYIRYRQRELPRFVQWKYLATGDYVLGLEPSNCWPIGGRAAERERGTLQFLEPGETREYALEIGVRAGHATLECAQHSH